MIFFADDLGYADVGCFHDSDQGPLGYATPEIDRLARRGRRFTDFLVSSAVCSASRAALLTGCLHARLGIHGAFGPDAKQGIRAGEVTLGELCRKRGYATACVGKWHLGHHPQFLPLQNGFDEYFGLPYSNDMWPLHPDLVQLPPEMQKRKQGYPPLPLYQGNEILDAEITADDQQMLAAQYTERAVDFIDRHRDRPFFLYVAPAMVHVPLFASPPFAGRTARGLFGDALEELDASLGQVVAALDRHGLRENTLVIFTSDNGPWLSYGDHAGSAGRFREGKGTAFEGGVRVPAIFSWPGKIPTDTVCSELACTIDLWPTICRIIGGQTPDHRIDGHDLGPLLSGEQGALSPHESLPLHYGGQLRAIRDRQWKLHFPHTYQSLDGQPGGTEGKPAPYQQRRIGLELYDLHADPSESVNVAAEHPDVVIRLQTAAESWREELGDQLTQHKGRGVRPPDRISDEK